ncbi:TonB-dependent receptor [Erythrobacter sp. NFXS35]|uniref:TonB-dependent receptor n=1 Tax=Erythrobacter sp. NFXS35 TaxID=2818436 RepID=UPI0032DF3A4E
MQVKKLKIVRSVMLATASGLAMPVLPAGAAAQTQQQSMPQANTEVTPQSTDDGAAKEIIVTARKRSESLSDVPISITALDNRELVRQGSRSIADIGRTTPGLVVVPSPFGSGGTPLIRGVSSFAGAATVGIYLDDVPLQFRPTPFAANPDPFLFDIDQVEVLRGPQGTLYGASSMGGTIRYVSRGPSFTEFTGQGRAEVASVDGGDMNYEIAGAIGGPIVEDVLAFRVSAAYRREGGFIERRSRTTNQIIEENIDDSEVFSVNATLAWRPTENLEIKPSLLYQRVETDDFPLFMPALLGLSQFNTSEQPATDYFYVPSLTVNYDFGSASLTSITSFMKKRSEGLTDYSTLQANFIIGADFLPGFEDLPSTSRATLDQKHVTQEIRLASTSDGPLSWIVGAFYRRTDDTFNQFVRDEAIDLLFIELTGVDTETLLGIPVLPNQGVFQGATRTIDEQYAAFGDLTYAITPQLKASVGVRISRSSVDFDRTTQGPLNGGVQTIQGTQSDTPITPKFGLSYQFDDGPLLYATAERGFRPGDVNAPVPADRCAADLAAFGGIVPENFDSDALWSYEVGAKADLFQRKLAVNLAVYQLDWTDIQQEIALPNCGFAFVDNLGTARSRGFEFEMQARPFEWLTLGARIGYVDAQLTSDILAPPNADTGEQGVISISGDPLVGIPDWTAALNGEISYPVSDRLEFYLRGDYQYIGSSVRTQPPGRLGHNPLVFMADSYDRSSLRAGLTTDTGLDLALFVDNLTNNQPVLLSTNGLSPITGTLRQSTLRPRTIGLQVSRQF